MPRPRCGAGHDPQLLGHSVRCPTGTLYAVSTAPRLDAPGLPAMGQPTDMQCRQIWLLFSNYIKPVLLKSVPSRDNVLDAFKSLEEEREGKAMLAYRQVIFLISFLPDEKVLPSHLPQQCGHRAAL